MTWLGDYPEDFATITVPFTTHDTTGAPVAPLSAFETADFKIYKNGNAAEKATANGLTIQSPHDSLAGAHILIIDSSNDTGDGGWWVAGAVYNVLLWPDTETVSGVAVGKWIGAFGIDLAGAAKAAAVAALQADLPQRPTKNVALAAFPFFMADSSDHVSGKTGLTITAERALDGGSFASCANAATEMSAGWYKIDLAATDLNGNTVALKFTSTGADPYNTALVTAPT